MGVTLVAAVADNGVIGADGDIPWRIPADFAHFKALTLGHVLVMGRATYESIGRPLPGRTTIVLTRDPDWAADGVLVAHDLDHALRLAVDLDDEVFVVGGARVYAEALPVADAQVLTEVHLSPEGDTRYPDFDRTAWIETRRDPHLDAEVPFEIVWWERA
jgi:dihydrofolate reductase